MAILGEFVNGPIKLAKPKSVKNADGSVELSVAFFDQYSNPFIRVSLELCHVIRRADGADWRSEPVIAPYKVTAPASLFADGPVGHTVDIVYYLAPTDAAPGSVQATAAAIN